VTVGRVGDDELVNLSERRGFGGVPVRCGGDDEIGRRRARDELGEVAGAAQSESTFQGKFRAVPATCFRVALNEMSAGTGTLYFMGSPWMPT
jgi:hypothetical protein